MHILKKNKIASNTIMLYLMTFAKMIFPLITLPYLTRILSIDGYAVVAYVKSAMVYMQIFLDFGFMLSATKEIARADNCKEKISEIFGEALTAKIVLAIAGCVIILISCFFIPILFDNIIYTFLAYISVALTILLPDFLFRGIEKMESITIRFIIMRGISTVLTFVFVKGDKQLFVIPILDIVGALSAIIWTWTEIYRLGYKPIFVSFKRVMNALKVSFIYFVSDAATTAFGALNTLLVGIYLSKQDIAFWSVAMQLISAVQSLYSPINSGIYPQMVRDKNMKLVVKIFSLCLPVIVGGTLFAYFGGEWVIVLISGEKYREAVGIFRWLLPLLLISFPSMLFGWPCLGAIDKQKAVTISTVSSAILQIVILVILIVMGHLSLFTIALTRIISEVLLLTVRLFYCYKYRREFNNFNG